VRVPFVSELLGQQPSPVIAATDYMRTVPDQIRQWVPGGYVTLGTDGFGRSDARAPLRRHFEVDRHFIALAALKALADGDQIDRRTVIEALGQFGIDPASQSTEQLMRVGGTAYPSVKYWCGSGWLQGRAHRRRPW
jgi:pyruvate dehydrogenase E1 component